jgi:hypothetical protein
MAKKKRRSVASYRAASLKAARTRRLMKQARSVYETDLAKKIWGPALGGTLDDMLPPEQTITRIPKVEWGK